MEFEIIQSESEDKEFGEFIHTKIRKYNDDKSFYHREARKPGAVTPLNVIVKDPSGGFIGGLSASTYWSWLEIDYFYLPEELRGAGFGTSLLRTAETIAVNRGCKSSFLTTFEFQARSFYEKQGYSVVGTLKDYPPGFEYYWMRKDFLPE